MPSSSSRRDFLASGCWALLVWLLKRQGRNEVERVAAIHEHGTSISSMSLTADNQHASKSFAQVFDYCAIEPKRIDVGQG
jgi:hypothetical protein